MEQGTASDQLEIERGSRAVGYLKRFGSHRQAVLNVILAHPGLPEKPDIRVRHAEQADILAFHDTKIAQDALELALGLGNEGI
jgi:hypothetical protein